MASGPDARLGWATLAGCCFLIATLAAIAAVLGSGLEGAERAAVAALVERRLGAVLMLLFAAGVFLFLLLRAAHEHLVLAPARAAEEAAALLEQPAARLTLQGSAELRALLASVNRLAEQRQQHDAEIATRIAAANAAAEADRQRFAALIAELTQGVIVCNRDGRILLYNRRARAQFAPAAGPSPLGLGRSIYGVFDRHLIAYALDNLAAQRGRPRHFVAADAGGRLLRVAVAPVADDGRLSGYLLMVEDMTESYDSESARDRLLRELTEDSRGAAANLRAAAETLHDYGDMDAAQRLRFIRVVRDEAALIGARIERAANEFAAVLKARWPLEEMLGADLVAAAAARIGERCGLPVTLEEVDTELRLRVDGFSLLQAIGHLAARLHEDHPLRELRLRLTGDGRMAHVDLIWQGVSMSTETVMNWELEPMSLAGESSPLTVRDVVERCGGEVWYQRERASHRAFFRFLLPALAGTPTVAPAASDGEAVDSRPAFYDFDLFRGDEAGGALDDRPLAQLAYTVFDTETTGLDPAAGDEIIQIGAVRILNRRILRQESYEQLVDPGRPVPAKSVRIHGITAETLAGQPKISAVLPVFRDFVGDTVLVAHNAAFDMRFLELKEAGTGVRFDRPVLDTFLLSAVLFPQQETHRLEAIAERLGVSVFGRHTALGDAIVTAEVFVKMIPLLADRGIRSLREARDASEKTHLARIAY